MPNPTNEDKAKSKDEFAEHAIIELMRKHFAPLSGNFVPFGDDVSAVSLQNGQVGVLKTDMLVAQTDVPVGISLWQAARKAIVMNVSDFAAKGVQPLVALVALGLPRDLTGKDLEDIAEGLNAGAREYGAYIVGGDTAEACDLIMAVQLFGTAQKEKLMLRKGTKAGDIVAVTGLFGKPPAGLNVLLKSGFASDGLCQVLVDSVYLPQARLKEGLALAASGAVSASMDSSDGLAWCLHELATQGGVGFVVSDLPVAKEAWEFAKANKLDAADLSLYGGEEYELVVTVNPKLWSKAEKAAKAAGGNLLPIGKATKDRKVVWEVKGEKRLIEARGYEHFKS